MDTRPLHARAWACRGEGLPAGTAADLISDKANRWNAEGEPTIYLSGDPALALVECGRHPDDLTDRTRLLEVEMRLSAAIDLRERGVRADLELPDELTWVLDRERTRRIATALRRDGCEALIVPSAGALDQPERWNAVLFADDREATSSVISAPQEIGTLTLRTEPSS
jgi:RES domain-containing protein